MSARETHVIATATVTFTRLDSVGGRLHHDVTLTLASPVTPSDLDPLELGWEAAEVWPEAGWGEDEAKWWLARVVVTVDGVVTDITPSNVR